MEMEDEKDQKGPWWPSGGAGCQKSVLVAFGWS